MRLRTLLVAALLGGVTLAIPVQAAGPQALTLEGSRTAWVELTLPEPTTFDMQHLAITNKGRFAGFYVEAIDPRLRTEWTAAAGLGAVLLRDLHAPGEGGITLELAHPDGATLAAGRYRLYLIADGTASVRIPISGSLGRRLRPTTPTTADVAAKSSILTSPIQASNTQPITVRGKRNITTSAILVGDFRLYAGQIGACLHQPEGDCGEHGVDGSWSGWMLAPLQDYNLLWQVGYLPGVLGPRRYDAWQGALDAATLQYASGAAFSLALV